eukprot:188611_1
MANSEASQHRCIVLSESPFGDKHCGRSPVLINDEIILSPYEDNHIYKFNTKSNKWSKHQFVDYKYIKWHAMCPSNDNKTLFILTTNQILLIVDIESMKVIKKIDNMSGVGANPSIIVDADNNKLLHIIGGECNKKHITFNLNDHSTNTICEFEIPLQFDWTCTSRCLDGGGIVHIKDKNVYLFFHYLIPIHSFDLHTKKWKKK